MSTYTGNRGSNRTSNLELLERELSLKQLQINRLLEVTQAINNNLASDALFKIYRSILSWEMRIEKMALYIKQDNFWSCTTAIGLAEEQQAIDITDELFKYARMTNLMDNKHPIVSNFDIIIPVYHKDRPIAFTILADVSAVLIGIYGRYLLTSLGDDPETILGNGGQNVLSLLVEKVMPLALIGFYVAAVLSAIMSTIDSLLVVASSAISRDFYQVRCNLTTSLILGTTICCCLIPRP